MKKIFNWQVVLGVCLILLTVVAYFIHYLLFRDAHHIFIYLVGDIAFVFFEVLLVTLIIHKVLAYREKKSMLNKLNMVIGTFFSEVGKELIDEFAVFDPKSDQLKEKFLIDKDWGKKDYCNLKDYVIKYQTTIEVDKKTLDNLKDYLITKRDFLLNLLANPNLLEHESFTNLLWALFHLVEELSNRKSFKKLPELDYKHLAGDIERVYYLLISEWIDYIKHLQREYPYLFSLAIRTNPFDVNACVEINV